MRGTTNLLALPILVESGVRYGRAIAFYEERGSPVSAIREVVMVRVKNGPPIDSPADDFGRTEGEVRARWERYFQSLRAGKTASPTGPDRLLDAVIG